MRGSSTQIGERTLFSYEYSFLSVSRVQSADGLTEMQAYVKKYYTTGLTWNPAGGEARAPVKAGVAPSPPPTPAGARPGPRQ